MKTTDPNSTYLIAFAIILISTCLIAGGYFRYGVYVGTLLLSWGIQLKIIERSDAKTLAIELRKGKGEVGK